MSKPTPTSLRISLLPIIGVAALILQLTSVSPARAAAGDYVALGDSYSAGVGTRAEADDCYRSPYGYPALIADQQGLPLSYQACNGATTADVLADQLSALSTSTAAVSLTAGGNDAGFADGLTECALPAWASDCQGAVDAGRAVITDELPGSYDALFAQIAASAPNADVVIAGYPLIFNGEDCQAATFFSPEDQDSIHSATAELNALLESKAAAYGFSYVDPRAAFDGHAVCDDPEWINGFSDPIVESYHPNRDGNIAFAELLAPALTGTPYDPAAAPRTAASGDPITVQEQADAVLAMDLDSPAALHRAEQQGLDPDRIERLVHRLRSADDDTVRSALNSLQQLDRQAS